MMFLMTFRKGKYIDIEIHESINTTKVIDLNGEKILSDHACVIWQSLKEMMTVCLLLFHPLNSTPILKRCP